MFQTNVAQKIKTNILCSIILFFFFENRVVYEIMWKNVVQPDRRIRFIWWITKATDTHSEYVIRIAFHCNNVCTNGSQCYVIRRLPVLLKRGMKLITLEE
jgi:hypothetical protein